MTDQATWFQYSADADEALAEIEQSLIVLENAANSAEEVRRLYRALHTLKGNSALLGLSNLEHLAHACEDMIGLVRDHQVPIGRHLVDLMLEVVDRLRTLVERVTSRHADVDPSDVSDLAERAVRWIEAHGGTHDVDQGGPKAYEIALWSCPAPAPEPGADPEAVALFLSLVRELLPTLCEAQNRAACPNDEAARANVERSRTDLRAAASRMGYEQVVDALDAIGRQSNESESTARRSAAGESVRSDDLCSLELSLLAALGRVEEQYSGLCPEAESFGVLGAYRQACAELAMSDVARLNTLLSSVESVHRQEIVGIFERLRAACEHLGFSSGASACLDLGDRALRQLDAGQPLDEASAATLAMLTAGIGRALRAVEDGRAPKDEPMLETVTEPPPVPIHWPMSEPLRSNLAPRAHGTILDLTSRGYALFEIHAHVECDVNLAKAFETWAKSADAVLLSSAVVTAPASEGGNGYHFLVASTMPASTLESQLSRIDGSSRIGVWPLAAGSAPTKPMQPEPPLVRVVVPEPAAPRDAVHDVGKAAVHEPLVHGPPTKVAIIHDSSQHLPAPSVSSIRADSSERMSMSTVSIASDGARVEASPTGDSLRIKAERVGVVMDLAGEIGLASSALIHHPDLRGQTLEGFSATAHKLEMLIRELQTEVACMRLVPVAAVFQRMKRVVRDTARRTGKQVELTLIGEDTEIDKVMVDRLQDPLVHILRNSIDHGIESPDERLRLNKPPVGTLILEASHRGGEVSIEVRDDGHGLDRERILARARERGLVGPNEHPSNQQIEDLIFLPGFSTKESIDAVSGRGVGMDVVKTTIESLRGRITVRSTPGQGSITNLTLPLTLAFLEAMIVRERERLYAIPIEKVLEVFKVEPQHVSRNSADGETLIAVHGELVKVMWLPLFYGEAKAEEVRERSLVGQVVVVVQSSRGALAVPIDVLLGNQQIMLKPLATPLTDIRAAAGYGMLRTGDVALTLDCERLHV